MFVSVDTWRVKKSSLKKLISDIGELMESDWRKEKGAKSTKKNDGAESAVCLISLIPPKVKIWYAGKWH